MPGMNIDRHNPKEKPDMGNPHDAEGFNELTEDEQRIKLTEYVLGRHKEALEIMEKTEGITFVSVQVMTREIEKLERFLVELRGR
jgi:hypothetical protein